MPDAPPTPTAPARPPETPTVEPPVILFDGVCNLCNGAVNFVIDRDPDARFKLAALQSEPGRALAARCGIDADALDSIVLVERGRCYTRSAAALRIARGLGGAWPLLAALEAVPAPLRDRIYAWVAANRYRWFGRRESCRVPTPELRGRFLLSA